MFYLEVKLDGAKNMKNVAKVLIAIAIVVAVVLVVSAQRSTPAFVDEQGNTLTNSIAEERYVEINDIEHYLLIRGRDTSKPILLFLHGGPGASAMPFNRRYAANLEDHFVVVNWDQRGAGKTFARQLGEQSLSLDLMIDDVAKVVDWLLAEFAREQLVLAGHSWGSMLGLEYISQHPEHISFYVGMGQMADTQKSEKQVYEWALEKARSENDNKGLATLNEIGLPPYDQVKKMMRHRGVVSQHGGNWYGQSLGDIDYVLTCLSVSEFSWLDIPALANGTSYSLSAFYDEFSNYSAVERYSSFEVPLLFILGRHDRVVSPDPAAQYLENVQAPIKEAVWFERSAHNPQWEEPDRFLAELLRFQAKL